MPTIKEDASDLIKSLEPSVGLVLRSDAEELCRLGRHYHRIQERWCNEEMSEGVEIATRHREKAIEDQVFDIAKRINVYAVEFSGDPRGATIKLKMPDGRADDWGGVGICVPGS